MSKLSQLTERASHWFLCMFGVQIFFLLSSCYGFNKRCINTWTLYIHVCFSILFTNSIHVCMCMYMYEVYWICIDLCLIDWLFVEIDSYLLCIMYIWRPLHVLLLYIEYPLLYLYGNIFFMGLVIGVILYRITAKMWGGAGGCVAGCGRILMTSPMFVGGTIFWGDMVNKVQHR